MGGVREVGGGCKHRRRHARGEGRQEVEAGKFGRWMGMWDAEQDASRF